MVANDTSAALGTPPPLREKDGAYDNETPAASESPTEYAGRMLSLLSLEEKVKLLSGSDLWRTNAVPRLGISKMKFSDGPVGVRGGIFADGVSAASLPTGVSLAATFDMDVIKAVCGILVAECKSKSVDVLLGPTVCIPRTPLGGRNFESYGEDPFLSGKFAATYIKSLQEAGIGACIKHFAANDQETRRFFIDAVIPERALREVHTRAFEIAIRESNPWSLMTAYNKVNGTYCSANETLLRDILRGEWGWNGLVMSDWFGTNTVVPGLKAGMDLEMPGPTRRRGKHLLRAYQEGLITTHHIDECVARVLELSHKVGKSNVPHWVEEPEKAVDLPEHRKILRGAAAEGIVLLKNEGGILPLKLKDDMKIAVIGPNAGRGVQSGGGSSNLEPHYRTTPLDSIRRAVTDKCATAEVKYAQGIQIHRYLPLINPSIMTDPVTGTPGFHVSYWTNMTHSGEPCFTEHRVSSYIVCYDGLPKELMAGERYSYQAQTILTPVTTGMHSLSLSTCGPAKVLLDGEVVIDIERHWWSPKSPLFMSYGSPEERITVALEGGRSYKLELISVSREPEPYEFTLTGEMIREEVKDGGRIGFLEEVRGDLFGDAVRLAKESDLVIMVVGKDHEWESETSDMPSMNLPGQSDALISAVLEANHNTVIVNQTGSAILMPWLDEAPAVVQAWYQGQEHANALTDVLLGAVNPCGKLPITFPRRYEDNPSYLNYPGGNDQVLYGEGIFIGYKYYDHLKIDPLFPFGFGLSYTTFEYSNMRLSSTTLGVDGSKPASGSITVQVDVRNTGTIAGKEIVQFYVSQTSTPGLIRPQRELRGWAKVLIEPGQTRSVSAMLNFESVCYWDDRPHKWVVDQSAEFEVIAARNVRDSGISAWFTVTST